MKIMVLSGLPEDGYTSLRGGLSFLRRGIEENR